MEFSARARRLWWVAIIIGAAAMAAAVLWVRSPQGPGTFDWVWGVMAFGVGVIAYNVAFFALCSMFLPGLSELVEDDTEIKGDTVTHVVRHAETGDENNDFYIRAYAAARGVSATTIGGAILIALALWFF